VDSPEPDLLRLTSGNESRTFSVAGIDSLWKMSVLFTDIYDSLTGPLGIADPSAEIGFAAINGMLSTLDSHSKLLTEKWYATASKPCPSCAATPPVAVLTSHMLSSDIGYIRLRSLPRVASSELRRALSDLSQTTEGKGQLRGFVLDLRGNPGGLVEEAIRVTNLFLEDGVVVKTVTDAGKERRDHRATKDAAVTRAPLIVLVDEGTAAGAEVVASALKDLDRGVVVGQRTNGEGTIQVVYEYGDADGIGKAYLKLTIGEMFRSSGGPIDLLGIVPDVVLVPTGASPPADAGVPDPATRVPTAERSLAELFYPRTESLPPSAPFVEDFPIRFAHDLLLRAPFPRRSEMLPHATALAAERR
jgi:C-terminal processing protease CtpA/Prc